MLRALKTDPGASNGENSKANGVKGKLAEKIKAPLRRLKQRGKPQANVPSQVTHRPVFAARNVPQGIEITSEDSRRRHQPRPKRAKHERREETKDHREEQYGVSARERDDEFLKHGPTELTRLYKPLSMNMSKTRKRCDEEIEYYGRYQFEELDFSGRLFCSFLPLIP